MLEFYVTLTNARATALDWSHKTLTRARDERGSVTLEMVVIALGVLLLAGAVVAVITTAVNSRVNQIK